MLEEQQSEETLNAEEETETSENTGEQEQEQEQTETTEENQELIKAQELARNQKIRAEKAEKELKRLKAREDDTSKKSENNYSLADIRALSKVHDDDIDRVEKFAKAEGLSYADALKSEDLQAILSSREEKRKTASASHMGTSRRGISKPMGEKLIEDFEAGKLPEDTDALAKALMERRKAKKV